MIKTYILETTIALIALQIIAIIAQRLVIIWGHLFWVTFAKQLCAAADGRGSRMDSWPPLTAAQPTWTPTGCRMPMEEQLLAYVKPITRNDEMLPKCQEN